MVEEGNLTLGRALGPFLDSLAFMRYNGNSLESVVDGAFCGSSIDTFKFDMATSNQCLLVPESSWNVECLDLTLILPKGDVCAFLRYPTPATMTIPALNGLQKVKEQKKTSAEKLQNFREIKCFSKCSVVQKHLPLVAMPTLRCALMLFFSSTAIKSAK